MKIWFLIGYFLRPVKDMIFWASSLVHKTTRVRVAIVRDEKILLVRNWGDNEWSLPGGGVHRREKLVDAASREVFEELGILIDPEKLIYSQTVECRFYHAPLFFFVIKDDMKVELNIRKWEIATAEWFDFDKAPRHSRLVDLAIETLGDREKFAIIEHSSPEVVS